MQIFAQIIGIVAMCFNILSYQAKRKKLLIAMQLCGASLFTLNYFLLGAYVGAMLNVLSVIRAVVFLFKEKLNTNHIAWQIAFCVCFLGVYVLSFTVLKKEPTFLNLAIELLPVMAMVIATVSYRLKNAAAIRKLSIFASPMWLIYNIFVESLGGIICESFAIISIIVGMFRLDRKDKLC